MYDYYAEYWDFSYPMVMAVVNQNKSQINNENFDVKEEQTSNQVDNNMQTRVRNYLENTENSNDNNDKSDNAHCPGTQTHEPRSYPSISKIVSLRDLLPFSRDIARFRFDRWYDDDDDDMMMMMFLHRW